MKIILTITILSFLCACEQRGHNPLSRAHYYEEKAVMFTVGYYKYHQHFPSYSIRELYYKHKDDEQFVDSLITKTPND